MVQRTHIRVVREDGREFPNMFVAYRELLGTAGDLGYSEHQRMRALIRQGFTPRDSHGFMWRAMHGGAALETDIRWSDFTFGVELELTAPFAQHAMREKLDAIQANGWRVVHDGSVDARPGFFPMEVVSPVLQGDNGTAMLKKVMDHLKSLGCKVNRSCGMHVHVGIRGMAIPRVKKIALAFLANEQHFDAVVPPERLTNRYCQSNLRVANRSMLENTSSISGIANAMNGGNSSARYNHFRYYKLNFQSYVQHGTAEFRLHSGTVESQKAIAWVRLVTGFCAKAAGEQVTTERQTFEQFVQCAGAEAAQYLTGRRAKFAAQRSRVAA